MARSPSYLGTVQQPLTILISGSRTQILTLPD